MPDPSRLTGFRLTGIIPLLGKACVNAQQIQPSPDCPSDAAVSMNVPRCKRLALDLLQ